MSKGVFYNQTVRVIGDVTIDNTTPLNIEITEPILIDSTIPVNTAIADPVVIDSTIPVDTNITNASIPITTVDPIEVIVDDIVDVNIVAPFPLTVTQFGSSVFDVNIVSPDPVPTTLSGNPTVIVEPGVDAISVEQAAPVLIDSTIPVDVNIVSPDPVNVRSPSFIEMYNDPVYQRYSQVVEFGGFVGAGIDNLPIDFSVSILEPYINNNTQVNISSDNAADTSRTIVIRGYNSVGAPIVETIMTDAVNGNTPVTTVNSFCNITEVAIQSESIGNVLGTIWIYRTSQVPVLGIPPRYISKVIGGNQQHNSFQPMLHAPVNRNVLINKLTIKEIGEIDNKEDHQIELITTSSANTQIYNTFTNIQYVRSFSKAPRTYENIVVPYNGSSSEGMLLGFMVLSTGENLTAQIEITFDYSFY